MCYNSVWKDVIVLVIRYERAAILPDKIRQAVLESYVRTVATDGAEFEGVFYTPFDLKRHIYLLDNLDLYIDDSLPEILYGYFLKTMRCYDFLDYKTIVPLKK